MEAHQKSDKICPLQISKRRLKAAKASVKNITNIFIPSTKTLKAFFPAERYPDVALDGDEGAPRVEEADVAERVVAGAGLHPGAQVALPVRLDPGHGRVLQRVLVPGRGLLRKGKGRSKWANCTSRRRRRRR